MSNVYGEHDDFSLDGLASGALIGRINGCQDKEIVLNGTGKNIRDFVYVGDVCSALLWAVNNKVNKTFNLGSGTETTTEAYANLIKNILNKDIEIKFNGQLGGDDYRVLDIERLKSSGFNSFTDIVVGLKKTIDWFISQ